MINRPLPVRHCSPIVSFELDAIEWRLSDLVDDKQLNGGAKIGQLCQLTWQTKPFNLVTLNRLEPDFKDLSYFQLHVLMKISEFSASECWASHLPTWSLFTWPIHLNPGGTQSGSQLTFGKSQLEEREASHFLFFQSYHSMKQLRERSFADLCQCNVPTAVRGAFSNATSGRPSDHQGRCLQKNMLCLSLLVFGLFFRQSCSENLDVSWMQYYDDLIE